MRRVNRFGLIAVIAAAAVAAPAFAGSVTVGRFYVEIAKAKHMGSVDATSAEANLRSAGFNLPSISLDKGLTENDVASISRTLGLSVTTTHPEAAISEGQMDQFVSTFGSQLGSPKSIVITPGTGGGGPTTDSSGGDPGNSGNGHGQKKGHNKSTQEPI
jgi:hypothetical protein